MSAWECRNSFALRCFDGNFLSFKSSKKYASKVKNRDIITVILNRKIGELSFQINNEDCGVALKNEILTKGEWYPTFGMQSQNEHLEFITNPLKPFSKPKNEMSPEQIEETSEINKIKTLHHQQMKFYSEKLKKEEEEIKSLKYDE